MSASTNFRIKQQSVIRVFDTRRLRVNQNS